MILVVVGVGSFFGEVAARFCSSRWYPVRVQG